MQTHERRLRGMLGFAMRAGRLRIGTEIVCSLLSSEKNRPRLVLYSHTASAQTKKKITNKGQYYGTETLEIQIDTEELGKLLGKEYTPAVLAVMDDGFANEIRQAVHAMKGSFQSETGDSNGI